MVPAAVGTFVIFLLNVLLEGWEICIMFFSFAEQWYLLALGHGTVGTFARFFDPFAEELYLLALGC